MVRIADPAIRRGFSGYSSVRRRARALGARGRRVASCYPDHHSLFLGGVAQLAEALVSDTRREGSNPSIPTRVVISSQLSVVSSVPSVTASIERAASDAARTTDY
jgi:hypothetical protein